MCSVNTTILRRAVATWFTYKLSLLADIVIFFCKYIIPFLLYAFCILRFFSSSIVSYVLWVQRQFGSVRYLSLLSYHVVPDG